MPDFLPFRGLRYRGGELSPVTSPPYDVIDDHERIELERTDPCNSVRLILPQDPDPNDADVDDRYAVAAATLARWRADGTLTVDERPCFYAYRMAFDADDGTRAVTTGVIGALGLPAAAGEGDVLPHERTLPKARSDRLALLRATRANFDPIWGLSLAEGLTDLLDHLADHAPAATCTDPDGTEHSLAVVDDPDDVAAIAGLVAAAPVVLADGHHRFETAIAHRDEAPDDPGATAIMTLVVELADEQLAVHPIHRVVSDAPDLRARVAEAFTVEPLPDDTDPAALAIRLRTEHALGLVDKAGLALLRPKDEVVAPRLAELPEPLRAVDAAMFDVVIAPLLDDATISYRAGAASVAAQVDQGVADAGVLLGPCPVDAIRAAAFAGVRMPQKTTFFAPKPRTGMVFRAFD